MSPPPHRVRRQSWRIRAGSAADAFALRRELRGALDAALLPAFERAFDRAAGGEETLRIPRLELRIRVSPGDDLAEVLPALIEREIGERLRELLPAATAGAGRIRGAPAGGSPEAGGVGALLHYLRTGALPWPEAAAPPEEAAEALRAAALSGREAVAEALRREPDPEPFAFRLLRLLGPDAPALVEALSPAAPEGWRAALARLLAAAGGTEARGAAGAAGAESAGGPAALRLAAAALAATARRSAPESLAGLLAAAAERLSPAERAAVAGLLASLAAAGEDPPHAPGREGGGAPPASRALFLVRGEAGAAPPGGAGGEAEIAGAPGAPRTNPVRAGPAGPGAPTASSEAGAFAHPAGEPLAAVVPLAGLALLHPFLVPLLERAGIGGRDGIPAPVLPRAAALLHHLATGRADPHEFELPFVKLLLGLSPEAPLAVAAGLVDARGEEEAESLLRSVILHWSALKGTSAEGVRASFLRRGGLLGREERGWLLRVEPAAFDLLLDFLPWGIGIVKLPWMPEPLRVEWTPR